MCLLVSLVVDAMKAKVQPKLVEASGDIKEVSGVESEEMPFLASGENANIQVLASGESEVGLDTDGAAQGKQTAQKEATSEDMEGEDNQAASEHDQTKMVEI